MYNITFAYDMIHAVDSFQSLNLETNKVWCDALSELLPDFFWDDEEENPNREELEELLESAYQAARQESGIDGEPSSSSEIRRLLATNELEAVQVFFYELYDNYEFLLDIKNYQQSELLGNNIADIVNEGYWRIVEKHLKPFQG